MIRQHEEFEVETDRVGEPPLSFWTETVRGVMVEKLRLALSLDKRVKCRPTESGTQSPDSAGSGRFDYAN